MTQGTLAISDGNGRNNYSLTFTTGNLTITARPITVTADPKTKIYGDDDPSLTYHVTAGALVSGDSFTGSLTQARGSTSAPTRSCTARWRSVMPMAATTTTLHLSVLRSRVVYLSTGSCPGQTGHQILHPINVDGISVVKKNSTVPSKFRVCDAAGNSVGLAGVVASFKLVQVSNGTVTSTVHETVLSTTPDTAFRWDSTDKLWICNISTKTLNANQTYFYENQAERRQRNPIPIRRQVS